jgi:hypothetical protein
LQQPYKAAVASQLRTAPSLSPSIAAIVTNLLHHSNTNKSRINGYSKDRNSDKALPFLLFYYTQHDRRQAERMGWPPRRRRSRPKE